MPIFFYHRKEFVGLNRVGGWMESGFGLDMVVDGNSCPCLIMHNHSVSQLSCHGSCWWWSIIKQTK